MKNNEVIKLKISSIILRYIFFTYLYIDSNKVNKMVNDLHFTTYPLPLGTIINERNMKSYTAFDRAIGTIMYDKYSISVYPANFTITHYSIYMIYIFIC